MAKLHPDLAEYLDPLRDGAVALRHPLVYRIPYDNLDAEHVNTWYTDKLAKIAIAEQERNWHQVISLHERAFRFYAFNKFADNLSDKDYWSILRSTWLDTENAFQNLQEWADRWASHRPGRHEFGMTNEEREALAGMQDFFPLYRGFSVDGAEVGLSWTTSRVKAKWFAQRFATAKHPGRVATLYTEASSVLAYLDQRGEQEVILYLDDVMLAEMDIVNVEDFDDGGEG